MDAPARSANDVHRPMASRMGAPVGAKLYLVSFKSNRADIFYLLPGFSFDPQPGDMVIVEGDRGHDLGIIQFANIDMDMAKAKREEYNIRHYRTLTMFSRMFPHIAAASTAEQFDAPTAAIAGHNLGQPRRRQDGTDEPPPMKSIRRVANLDEIQMLQEKEGNEARAKRICQAKVTDHGIRMEILDAEFQVDYKKLTFYFYAEQYVNFNDLVSDLFKVWKLRIWLSAVNPNSYPPPATGVRRGRGHPEGFGYDMR
jgi:cell fate regulator YaaT (PSP1 superfamily)